MFICTGTCEFISVNMCMRACVFRERESGVEMRENVFLVVHENM